MDRNETPSEGTGAGHPRLLRCRMREAAEHGSVRYVELEQFTLWEHFMRARHRIQIQELELCLWLEKSEYTNSAAVFEHAGRIDPVHRIEVTVYDAGYHYSVTVRRYADANDAPFVADLLLKHAQQDSGPDECSVRIVEGRCVRVGKVSDRRALLLGLTCGAGRAPHSARAMRAAG
ncbi:MAG TPA: hypothetical protein VFL15_05640 [Gammaproteobacteria bacterium]|nr:hypothetical protein [Gammaproteobacteria bacterium]